MSYRQIQGNERICEALAGMVDSGKVPHAMLFHDEDGGQAFAICQAFLQYLYCKSRTGKDSCGNCPQCNKTGKMIHPDVHYVFPTASNMLSMQFASEFRNLAMRNPRFTEDELASALGIEGKKQMIAVGESKQLLDELSVSALEGGYRSVVIFLPELMNAEAANRLLKIIEEPPQLTVFLLISHHPEKVLRTISSRCQHIAVGRSGGDAAAASFSDPGLYEDLMDALCASDWLAALDAADALAALPSRDAARSFCRYAAWSLREIFLAQQGLSRTGSARAASLPANFPRKALGALDDAARKIELNINLKILFTDLANKLYIYAK